MTTMEYFNFEFSIFQFTNKFPLKDLDYLREKLQNMRQSNIEIEIIGAEDSATIKLSEEQKRYVYI